MTFGAFISTRRKEAKLNLRDTAKHLGISNGYLCDIEQGRRPAPEGAFVERISSFLELDKTEHILGLVSQLRPDMVKQLKTAGSGKLPKDIQRRKTEHFTASANDAFATIRITARDCGEGACEEALSYLIEILEQPEFPRSYSIEFRGPEKIYLPIPGLPKKGVHQLFACAVRYPRLHVRMEN